MERSVIHHDHSLWRKCGEKLLFEPEFKQAAVYHTRIFHLRDDLLAKLGRNNLYSFILAAADCGIDLWPSGSISEFPVQVCVDSNFIYMSKFVLVRCLRFLSGMYPDVPAHMRSTFLARFLHPHTIGAGISVPFFPLLFPESDCAGGRFEYDFFVISPTPFKRELSGKNVKNIQKQLL